MALYPMGLPGNHFRVFPNLWWKTSAEKQTSISAEIPFGVKIHCPSSSPWQTIAWKTMALTLDTSEVCCNKEIQTERTG